MPAALGRRVLWYACGEEAWHGCDRLEDVTAGSLVQVLASTAGTNDIFHSGWLARDAAETAPNQFRCDPREEDLLATEHQERADADPAVLLHEILADGQAIFLSSDLLRLGYRHVPDHPTPVIAGETMTVRFGAARFFARTLARHSRLRLVVRHAMGPEFQRNGNSGKPVQEETLADRRVVPVTVIHDGPERSRRLLPLASLHPTIDMTM